MSTKTVMGTTETGRRRNRSWPETLKREIVSASLVPGCSVSVIARRYDVNANQLFSWRRLYRDSLVPSAAPTAPQLVPVMVTAEQGSDGSRAASAAIEIELAGRYRIRVRGGVDEQALRRVLDVLEGR